MSEEAMFIHSFGTAAKGWLVGNYESVFPVASPWWGDAIAPITASFQTSAFPFLTVADFNSSTIANWMAPFAIKAPAVMQANNATIIVSSDVRNSQETVARIPISESAQNKLDAVPAVEVIAEWDGYVEEIYSDYFSASMRGLRGFGVVGQEEEAEIPISDVDPEDRDLLVEGGFFRLMIAYESPRVGPRKRYTTVQFRRLPAFTKRELDARDREADELVNGFQLEESSKSAGA
jgi:hypothetical protein